MSLTLRFAGLLAVVAALMAIPPGNAAAGGSVENTLREWEITAAPSAGQEGSFTFQVFNNGVLPHNFIVVDTDLAPSGLPLTADGLFVDETRISIVGRTSILPTGGFETLTLNMPPGNYVLICNNDASHYTAGMYRGFQVSAAPPPPTQQPTNGGPTVPNDGPTVPNGGPTDGTSTNGGTSSGTTGGPVTGYGPRGTSMGYWWLLPGLAAAGAGLLALGTAIRRRTR